MCVLWIEVPTLVRSPPHASGRKEKGPERRKRGYSGLSRVPRGTPLTTFLGGGPVQFGAGSAARSLKGNLAPPEQRRGALGEGRRGVYPPGTQNDAIPLRRGCAILDLEPRGPTAVRTKPRGALRSPYKGVAPKAWFLRRTLLVSSVNKGQWRPPTPIPLCSSQARAAPESNWCPKRLCAV